MPARGLFPLISYKTYHLLCSEWWALPHLATCPLSLRNQPLGSACALTSTLNCFHLLFLFLPIFLVFRALDHKHMSQIPAFPAQASSLQAPGRLAWLRKEAEPSTLRAGLARLTPSALSIGILRHFSIFFSLFFTFPFFMCEMV